jgi:hypothetical protein
MQGKNQLKGIAIGPVLFVIAILAVLVGALSSGSAGFNSNSASEAEKTRGSTIIQQGVTLKMGAENILVHGFNADEVVVSADYTDAVKLRALYSPAGGAILKQIPPSEATAPSAVWAITRDANMYGIGVAADNDLVAYVKISNARQCAAINEVVFGRGSPLVTTLPIITETVVAADVTTQDGLVAAGNAFETDGVNELTGRMQACVRDSEGTPNYWYYQVMKAN